MDIQLKTYICFNYSRESYSHTIIHLALPRSYSRTSIPELAPWGLPLLPLQTFGNPVPKLGRTTTQCMDGWIVPPLQPHPEMNGMDHGRQWSGHCQSGSGPQLRQQL